MRILVTGASGNVGTALLKRLVPAGHEVVGLARRVPAPVGPYAGVSWAAVDLTSPTATDRVADLARGADAVVHLAWGFQPTHDPAYLLRLDVGGTGAVVDAALEAGVPHVVHMSSVGAYSARTRDVPVTESWPVAGIPSLPYSQHKAAAESLLDDVERRYGSAVTVARVRPSLIGQRAAGSALLRYTVPSLLPGAALRWLPVLPLDRSLAVQLLHADDVADAVVRILDQRAQGAYNLASDEVLRVPEIAAALGARPVHVPYRALRAAASVTWQARLQPVSPGWLDLAYSAPLLDSGRARSQLGWMPTRTAPSVLAEVLDGMRHSSGTASQVLRPSRWIDSAVRLVRKGPVAGRRVT
jgi:nucleoside-diphosphate-sugar epimerase